MLEALSKSLSALSVSDPLSRAWSMGFVVRSASAQTIERLEVYLIRLPFQGPGTDVC
ncbi:MAG: hypothetical protein KC588_03685 [Nitrospira sp.]|nr:hypothetical protein [Nitrospira sp.]